MEIKALKSHFQDLPIIIHILVLSPYLVVVTFGVTAISG